jgi:hypothetical protein
MSAPPSRTNLAQPGQNIDLPEPPTVKAAVSALRFEPTGLEYLARFEELQRQNSVLAQVFWKEHQYEIKIGMAARQHQAIVDAARAAEPPKARVNSVSAQMANLPAREQRRFFLAHRREIEAEASAGIDQAIHATVPRREVRNLSNLATSVQGT